MNIDNQSVPGFLSPVIKGDSTGVKLTNDSPSEASQEGLISPPETRAGRYGWLLSPLWICLLIALVIRVVLIIRTHGGMDGDEALLGIQAEHILQGERPIYFYGIPYFGSLEAYGAALLFALFGPSVAALRIETTFYCLLLVATTWWLASLLAHTAHLSPLARKWFTFTAGMVAALPPLYDGIVELRTGGGWIESFLIMLLLLTLIYRLTMRWREKAPALELALLWAAVGFAIGFGMWIYPLVSVAILAAALWVVIDRLTVIVEYIKASESAWRAIFLALKQLPLVLAAVPACVLGFTPGIIWGLANDWANIKYIFSLGGGWTMQRLLTVKSVTHMYVTCVAPRIVGGGTPFEDTSLNKLHMGLLTISLLCLGLSLILLVGSWFRSSTLLVSARRLLGLPILFSLCSATLFCVSSASTAILGPCQNDWGGRYASPLVLVLPFFFAAILALGITWLQKRSQRADNSPAPASQGRPGRFSSWGIQGRSAWLSLAVLLLVLCAYLGGQALSYKMTDGQQSFESPWCTRTPADYQPIIQYMQQEHIQYFWANNLLGDPITFMTDNTIITANPTSVFHPDSTSNRLPAYTEAVEKADRPSFLILVPAGQQQPRLLQLLDQGGVTYKTALFPAQQGYDVMVVTPLNHTVSLFASTQFDLFYC